MPSSENPRVGVDIGPEVLNFARHQEDGGHQKVQLGHQLEQFVSWEVLECKLPLPGIVRIFLFKYSITIVILYKYLLVSEKGGCDSHSLGPPGLT